jgi:hypothetical protein
MLTQEATAETRRVAELLTQLPTEINVEELVTRSVFPRARLSLLDGESVSHLRPGRGFDLALPNQGQLEAVCE